MTQKVVTACLMTFGSYLQYRDHHMYKLVNVRHVQSVLCCKLSNVGLLTNGHCMSTSCERLYQLDRCSYS